VAICIFFLIFYNMIICILNKRMHMKAKRPLLNSLPFNQLGKTNVIGLVYVIANYLTFAFLIGEV
jgi:hypothetical protein